VKNYFQIFLTALVLCLCGLAPIAHAQTPSAEIDSYKTGENISYRTNLDLTGYAKERCLLDIYYPTGTNGFDTVVWFHGGGLTNGNRFIPAALKGKGIAVVGVSYRLSPRAKAPAYIEDAAAAVAWTFRNIATYGGNPNRIFVSGHSAGGYLTLMLGLDKHWLAAEGVDADRIAGLVPFSGQCITHFTIRAERGIRDTRPVVDELAPLYHVRKDAPPLLLLTGDRTMELLGRYEENAYLWRMMKLVAHPDTEIQELPGLSHVGMIQPSFPLLLQFMTNHPAGAVGHR